MKESPMTQNVNAYPSKKPVLKRFWSLQKFGWISSLSLLSGGIAMAQTPAAEVLISAPASTQPTDAAPVAQTPPLPAAPVMPSAPETIPAIPAAPVAPQPAPIPQIEVPTSKAASDYDQPTSVVLSDRSMNCQTVVQYGSNVTGLCGSIPPATVGRSPNGLPGAVSVAQASVGSSNGLSYVPSSDLQNYYRRTLRPPGRLGNGNIRLIFPLSMPAAISSVFGWRVHPITGEQRFHSGTDLAAPQGTPVLAAFAGRVAIADFLGGYGLTITLQHNNGTQETLYGHLSEVFVKPGEWVKQGDVIGRVGSTGFSTGPHLHFEFRQQTPDGWVAMDAGTQLEFALGQLVKSMEAPKQARK
jgi:hypothetical protein